MTDRERGICRVNRTKEEAKSSYDKLSPWYDMLVWRSEKKFKDASLQQLRITEGEKILEIGFGTGQCTIPSPDAPRPRPPPETYRAFLTIFSHFIDDLWQLRTFGF